MYPQKEVTFGKVLGGYVFIHVYTNVKPGSHARLFERDTNRIRGICKSDKKNRVSIINRDETARGEKLPEPNQFVHISMNSSSPKIASKISSNFFFHKANGVQFLWKDIVRALLQSATQIFDYVPCQAVGSICEKGRGGGSCAFLRRDTGGRSSVHLSGKGKEIVKLACKGK